MYTDTIIYRDHQVSFCSLGPNQIHNLPLKIIKEGKDNIQLTHSIFRDLLKLKIIDETNELFFGYDKDDFHNLIFYEFNIREITGGYINKALGDKFAKEAIKNTDNAIDFFNKHFNGLVGMEVPNRKAELLVEFFVLEMYSEINTFENNIEDINQLDDFFASLGNTYRPVIFTEKEELVEYEFYDEWIKCKESIDEKIKNREA